MHKLYGSGCPGSVYKCGISSGVNGCIIGPQDRLRGFASRFVLSGRCFYELTRGPRPASQPSPLLGTWEFVSARKSDGRENSAYVKAFKDKRYIKMVTPTHFIAVTIEPATGKITGAHGGGCFLGNGQLTEWPQYGTAPSWIRAKSVHFNVRFEDDKFVQSFEDGNAETWRRAKADDVTISDSRLGTENAITPPLVGTWEFVSARKPDGRENPAYAKAFKDKRQIKIITPTHFICVSIDPPTGKITGARGGPCLLGNGQLTEWSQYGTDPSRVQLVKGGHFKVRFEDDKFVQSSEDGSEETWQRAKAADVAPTAEDTSATANNSNAAQSKPRAALDPEKASQRGWIPLFDGKTLSGWTATVRSAGTRPDWSVAADGSIVGKGPVSHLFSPGVYTNLEFKAEAKVGARGNSGMYFRASPRPTPTGFPEGYEAQIENTGPDPNKTGSLWGFNKVAEQLVEDDTWFTQHVIAIGNRIVIKVNNRIVTDFVDANNTYRSGQLALQKNAGPALIRFRNVMVKALPADEALAWAEALKDMPDLTP